jgi:hypothetical protein
MNRNLHVLSLFLLSFSGSAQSTDLQIADVAVSQSQIFYQSAAAVSISIRQNGPDELPANAARITVTVDPRFIRWTNFLPDPVWKITMSGPATLRLSNKVALATAFRGEVELPFLSGMESGESIIAVSSTVFGKKVSDPVGNNQSGHVHLHVDGMAYSQRYENASPALRLTASQDGQRNIHVRLVSPENQINTLVSLITMTGQVIETRAIALQSGINTVVFSGQALSGTVCLIQCKSALGILSSRILLQ